MTVRGTAAHAWLGRQPALSSAPPWAQRLQAHQGSRPAAALDLEAMPGRRHAGARDAAHQGAVAAGGRPNKSRLPSLQGSVALGGRTDAGGRPRRLAARAAAAACGGAVARACEAPRRSREAAGWTPLPRRHPGREGTGAWQGARCHQAELGARAQRPHPASAARALSQAA